MYVKIKNTSGNTIKKDLFSNTAANDGGLIIKAEVRNAIDLELGISANSEDLIQMLDSYQKEQINLEITEWGQEPQRNQTRFEYQDFIFEVVEVKNPASNQMQIVGLIMGLGESGDDGWIDIEGYESLLQYLQTNYEEAFFSERENMREARKLQDLSHYPRFDRHTEAFQSGE